MLSFATEPAHYVQQFLYSDASQSKQILLGKLTSMRTHVQSCEVSITYKYINSGAVS